MDYREELLNKTLLMLYEEGIKDLDRIKNVLIRAISDYEISERCTEVAIIDDSNVNIIKTFLATKKIEGGSNRTAKNRWYVVNKFNNDVNKPFSEITSFDILNWFAKERQTICVNTLGSYRSILLSFFSWMYKNKIIQENPIENIKPIKQHKIVKESFTPVEVDALKSSCKKTVDRAIIELLITSGMRCEELCNLKWKDINFTTKDIKINAGKGNKDRVTMMDDVTRKYLLMHKSETRYKSEYVFATQYRGMIKPRSTNSTWRKIKSIAYKANVSEAYPHKFRRTCATILYKRGLDLQMIQKLLGHSNINTTMIYIDGNIDMLRNAYENCV